MPTTQSLDRIYREHRELFLRKLADYGTADISEVGIQGVLSRLTDKLARLKHLTTDGAARVPRVSTETLEDTALDVMGYGMIALLLLRDEWEQKGPDLIDGILENSNTAIQVKVTSAGGGLLPPAREGDAGFDLAASEDCEIAVWGERPTSVPLGFAAKLPDGHWAEIRPRSSTATKMGIFVFPSVMDSGYTGPWYVVASSLSRVPVKVKRGQKIAQCILHRMDVPDVLPVSGLPETPRGAAGFGSTGIKV